MSDIQLGLLIEGEAHRDAIHVAVAPVSSDEQLQPGQRVALVEGRCDRVKASNHATVGIVDPFLRMPVQPGQRFWLCLYVKTVTSLRHEWTHPAFKEEAKPDTSASEAWLHAYADELGVLYQDLMHGAKRWVKNGEYYNEGETLEGMSVHERFWEHYENVTGEKVEGDSRQSFFTCSC